MLEHPFVTVLGLTGLLAITSLLLPVARRIAFPYTVLLALLGVALGALVAVLRGVEGLWVLGDFVAALDGIGITSEAVFFVFLPTLVFESALSIDVRRLSATKPATRSNACSTSGSAPPSSRSRRSRSLIPTTRARCSRDYLSASPSDSRTPTMTPCSRTQ